MERIVDVGGAHLPVLDIGSGTPVVMLHAGVSDRRSWAGVVEALESQLRDIRLITYDRRGFGGATWTPSQHTHMADLFAVLDACGIEKAVLVGNSQGGRIAIEAALTNPDRVSGLMLVAPAVSGAPGPSTDEQSQITRLTQAIDAAEVLEDLDLVNELEAQLWLDGPGSTAGRVSGPTRALFLEMNSRALRAEDVGATMWTTDSMSRLGELHLPTTVIVGDLDLPHLISRAHTIAGTVPEAELVIMPNCAHLPAFESPICFAAELNRFIERIGRIDR